MALFLPALVPARDYNGNPAGLATWSFFLANTTTPAELDDPVETVVTADANGVFEQLTLDPAIEYRAVQMAADGRRLQGIPKVTDTHFAPATEMALDSGGDPIPGARWVFTESGGNNPVSVYGDWLLDTPLGASVEADAAGMFPDIYLDDAITYAADLTDATGAVIATIDPVTAQEMYDYFYPTISIAATDAVKDEGQTGTTAFTFTVTRTGRTSTACSASWAVTGSSGAPANAADFGGTFPSGTVNFAAGETSKLITVNVTGDDVIEPDEGFTVTLSLGIGCDIGTNTATGSIVDDDTPLIADLSRNADAMTGFVNAFGDSTTGGVGSATGSDWPNAYRTLVTGPTAGFHGSSVGGNIGTSIVDIGNGGVGGENTASITARVTGLSPTYSSELGRDSFYAGGLNDYNSVVSGWARDWPSQVKANYATAAAALTGGKGMYALLAPAENNATDGARYGADHRFHALDMATTYGNKAIDLARYLRFIRQMEAPSGTADAEALANGQIPYKYRGGTSTHSSTDFADVDFATISGAGAPASLAYAEGTIYFNTTNNSSYRKYGASGAGSWTLTDTKHFSKWGNNVIARLAADVAKASEGNGPPVCPPARFRIAADASNGAAVGTVPTIGTATHYSLRTYADAAATGFAISSAGAITKTGTLTEGLTELVVVAKNANGVLVSPVDIFVTRPSTETAPELRTIASPYISMTARDAHGMADSKQISGAFWFNLASLASINQLVVATRTTTPGTPINIHVTASGVFRVVIYDSANTLVANLSASGGTVTTGSGFWVPFAFDFATNTRCAYLNETALTLGSITNGTNISLSDCNPMFLATRAPVEQTAIISPLTGQIGFAMFTDGYIDWTDSANRRLLYAADGTPATRTPYAAIGGVTPKLEMWGGNGDWLWGSPDGSVGAGLLSVSHKAKTLMS